MKEYEMQRIRQDRTRKNENSNMNKNKKCKGLDRTGQDKTG